MRRFPIYLRLQLKRALRLLPRMLAVTLLLAVLTALAALLLTNTTGREDEKLPVRVALVADWEDGYLSQGLELLKSMDSSRFSFSLEPMSEEEAARALRRGELDGYAVIPEGFAEAMMLGEHRPIRYVALSGGADLGAQITREIAETVSALILETENAVYGAQDYAAERLPGIDPYGAGDQLVLRYALRILDRERLYTLETPEGAAALSLPAYYLCGVSVLFVLLWAVSCTPLFAARPRELGLLLRAQGLGSAGQLLAEYLSYVLLMLSALLFAGLAAGLLLRRFGVIIPELDALGAARFALGALPPALMLCALQLLLFELAESTVGAVLLQFFNAAAQGYLAGCFYPASFFPEGLRRVSALLPASAAMNELRALLLRERGALWPVLLWLALCLGGAVLVRERRALGGGEAGR